MTTEAKIGERLKPGNAGDCPQPPEAKREAQADSPLQIPGETKPVDTLILNF